jgi:multicomponent K+:H+ antiporter subunit D
VARQRSAGGDRLDVVDAMPQAGLLGALFIVAAVSMSGLPPLTGFAGKIMILDAARYSGLAVATWSILLVAALVVIVALARAGSALFWRVADGRSAQPGQPPVTPRALASIGLLLGAVVAMVAWGGSVTAYAWDTAGQLARPSVYVEAVLGTAADDRRSLR